LTVWVMSVCNFRSNKYGLLKYKNGTAIKSLSALKKYLEMSDYRWRLVSKDVVKYSLIKEQVHDLNTYLVVNPLYTSSNYEITQYKFMAFHRELREAVLPLEYLYLCKKFEIIP